MIAERLRILGLYAVRYVFGMTLSEYAAALKDLLSRFLGRIYRRETATITASHCAADYHQDAANFFDRQYGTTTGGRAHFFELRSRRLVDAFATGYAPCPPSIVRRSLELLPAAPDRTFLDLGCGEGRALVIASEFSFRAIVGVELSPTLCATASANATLTSRRFPGRTPISIVQADAGAYPIPAGPTVVFMYHPFQKPVMKRVLARLERAVQQRTGELFVVYLNPVLGHMFDRSSSFARYFAGMLPAEDSEGTSSTSPHGALVIWRDSSRGKVAPRTGADSRIRVTSPGWRAELEY